MSEDYEFETYTFGERVHFDRGFRGLSLRTGTMTFGWCSTTDPWDGTRRATT